MLTIIDNVVGLLIVKTNLYGISGALIGLLFILNAKKPVNIND